MYYYDEQCQSCGSIVLSCGHCSSMRDKECETCQVIEED